MGRCQAALHTDEVRTGRQLSDHLRAERAGARVTASDLGGLDPAEIWDLESWNKYQEETEAAFSAADDDDILSGLL